MSRGISHRPHIGIVRHRIHEHERMACRTKGCLRTPSNSEAHNGDTGEAYYAWPTGAGKFPSVVLIHHMPGWDEWITEATRKLAHHGFATIAPHLYFREGAGQPGRRRRPRSRGRRRGRRPGGRRRRGRRGLSAGAAPCQRQGRRDRLLLRRPPRLPGRLPRRRRSSTRWSIAGAATSSSTIPRRSTPSARSRRSISPTTSNARSSAFSATTTRIRTRIRSTAPKPC